MLGTATDDLYFEFWTNYAVKGTCLLKMTLKVIFLINQQIKKCQFMLAN